MGILDLFRITTKDSEEELRTRARTILYNIIEIERQIERWESVLRKAKQRGNDPAEIRADIVQAEVRKLDLERKLELIDKRIIQEERVNIKRAA